MKKLIYLGLIVAALVYFNPRMPNYSPQKILSRLKSIGKSEAKYRNELQRKQAKLAAYEKAIIDITISIENTLANANANGPICPTTGNRAVTTLTKDPRDELQAECETLREEIQSLEEKIGG